MIFLLVGKSLPNVVECISLVFVIHLLGENLVLLIPVCDHKLRVLSH